MGRQLDTGTGANRRRLTLEEAQRGDAPTKFTREEWLAMYAAAMADSGRVLSAFLRNWGEHA